MKANENPFRSSSVERIRYALDCSALNRLVDTALELRLSSLIGPHGTGKTTLLEDLEPLLNERGHPTHWLRLNLDSSPDQRKAAIEQIQTLAPKCFCLFDGAEVLTRWQQFQLRRVVRKRGLGLIATLHRKSPLAPLYRTEPDWQLTEQLVRQLAAEHCNNGLIHQARLAFEQSSGNMREVFRACYWQLAT